MVCEKYGSGVGEIVGTGVAVGVESCVAVGSGVSVHVGITVGTGSGEAQAVNINSNKAVNQNLCFMGSPSGLLLYPSQAL